MDLDISSIFHGWKVEKLIGEGAFGKVYKIVRTDFGNIYESALKVIEIPSNRAELDSIQNEGMTEESATAYFKSVVEDIVNEYRLMSKLKGNSNIVSYEDHAVVKKENEFGWRIYIRMELVTSLYTYQKNHLMSMVDGIHLGIDVCRALEVCRKFNIIHRDIKPENIFVSDIGSFKLGDFGVARQLEKTSSGLSRKGTEAYMAPEVVKREAYNQTVDIYALGIVLYKYFNNNRTPFLPPVPEPIRYSDKEKAFNRRMNGDEFPPPCDASEAMTRVILKACAYNTKNRYQNAEEMRKELEEILKREENNYQIKNIQEGVHSEIEKMDKEKRETVLEENEDLIINEAEDIERTVYERKEVKSTNVIEKEQIKWDIVDRETPKKEIQKKGKQENQPRKQGNRQKVLIVVSVLFIISIIGGIGAFMSDKLRKVVVPDLYNLTFENAKSVLEQNSLFIEQQKEEYSESIKKGRVITQNITKDTKVEKGIHITVIVSKGKKPAKIESLEVAVPNLKGLTKEEAIRSCSDAAIIGKAKEDYSAESEKGKVIKQEPAYGETVLEGDSITVIVGKGIQKIEVPSLKGKKEQKAIMLLKRCNLLYKVNYEYNKSIEKGRVISQSVNAGMEVKINSKIKITVSKGKKPVSKTSVPVVTHTPVIRTQVPIIYTPKHTITPQIIATSKPKKDYEDDISEWDLVG